MCYGVAEGAAHLPRLRQRVHEPAVQLRVKLHSRRCSVGAGGWVSSGNLSRLPRLRLQSPRTALRARRRRDTTHNKARLRRRVQRSAVGGKRGGHTASTSSSTPQLAAKRRASQDNCVNSVQPRRGGQERAGRGLSTVLSRIRLWVDRLRLSKLRPCFAGGGRARSSEKRRGRVF